MKQLLLIIIYFNTTSIYSQTLRDKEESMRPALWLKIPDYTNSTLKIDSLGYGDLPTEIEYRGVIVEAIQWVDNLGSNILLLTQTGAFSYKDTIGEEISRSELFAYLFQNAPKEKQYRKLWRLYDFENCFGVDMYAGFYQHSLTITDIDNDNIGEVTFVYKLSCRGGADPATQKLVMYEKNDKYMLRGETLMPAGDPKINSSNNFKADNKFNTSPTFLGFAKKRWSTIGLDDFKQFR